MSRYGAVAAVVQAVACLDCGALVIDQAAHDVHHRSDSNRDRLHQLELERTMPSRLA